MLDSDGLVEGWAGITLDPKVAGSSLNRFFCKLLVLIISFYVVFFGVHCFSSAVFLNKINYN